MQCFGQRVDGTNTFSCDQLPSVFDLAFLCSMMKPFGFVLINNLCDNFVNKDVHKSLSNSLVSNCFHLHEVLLARKL